MDNSTVFIEGQLRECFGRSAYSHKTHEKCADILLARLSRIKFLQIVLAAITTGSFLTSILGSGKEAAIVGVIVSAILLVLNAYTKDYDLGELAQKHKHAANDIWLIREQYLSLLTDLAAGVKTIKEIQAERDRLVIALHGVYSGSPSTTNAAYKKAQQALQKNQELTFSDAEIDAFLPKELRRAAKLAATGGAT
jgi:SMODS and SLOG-associating 2TM effector domain family 4